MSKNAFITKQQAEDICKEFPTPFHIYSEDGIRTVIRNLKKAFSWNKGYREYFAVKACPNPFLIKIMQEEGHTIALHTASHWYEKIYRKI